jgi:hypothetical protein
MKRGTGTYYFFLLGIFLIFSLCARDAGAGGHPESYTYLVPADFPSIQAAIDYAADGDTVLVGPGTYVENIDFLGKLITVRSTDGRGVTTIDGGGGGSVVSFRTGETGESVLDGFTITNGDAFGGGGIYVYAWRGSPSPQSRTAPSRTTRPRTRGAACTSRVPIRW